MPAIPLFPPFGTDINLTEGVMQNPDNRIERRASDMRGYYANPNALEALIRNGDPVLYEVFEKDIPDEKGHLRVAISQIQPGTVGEECAMTKGHYHAVPGTGEVYLGLKGRGRILMKTAEGKTTEEDMTPGRMVYVPPYWAHRSVNTGDEPLIFFCVWPGSAGHNYGDIEREGFPQRVVKRNGEIQIVRCEDDRSG